MSSNRILNTERTILDIERDTPNNYYKSVDFIKRINKLLGKLITDQPIFLTMFLNSGWEGVIFKTNYKGIVCKIITHKKMYIDKKNPNREWIFRENDWYKSSLELYQYLSKKILGPHVYKIFPKIYIPWENNERKDLLNRFYKDCINFNIPHNFDFIEENGFPISIIFMEELNVRDQGTYCERIWLYKQLNNDHTINKIGQTCDYEFGRNEDGQLVLVDILQGKMNQDEFNRIVNGDTYRG